MEEAPGNAGDYHCGDVGGAHDGCVLFLVVLVILVMTTMTMIKACPMQGFGTRQQLWNGCKTTLLHLEAIQAGCLSFDHILHFFLE